MIDTKIGATAWRESGDGTPVVFLHGLGGTRESWNPQLTDMSAQWRCLAWDMPGYGDSDPETPLTFPSIASRLVDFLDAASIDSAHLVGLSFGGMHALHTALRFPGRVRSLVLADTSAAFGADPDEWISARLQGFDPSVIDAIVGRPLTPTIAAELKAAFSRIPAEGFAAALHCLVTHDVVDQLSGILTPTLVMVGALDEETPVSYSRTLVDGIADATLVVLDGVGHLSPSEAPEVFNHHLRSFLAHIESLPHTEREST